MTEINTKLITTNEFSLLLRYANNAVGVKNTIEHALMNN